MTSVFRNYDETSNKLKYVVDKVYHTSLKFVINKDISFIIIETTKPQIFIKGFKNKEWKGFYTQTSLKNIGSLDKNIIAY